MLVGKMQNYNLVVLVFVIPDVAEMAVVLVDFEMVAGMVAEMVELDIFDCFVNDILTSISYMFVFWGVKII